MKSKLLLLCTAALLLIPTKEKAQVSAYTFSQSSSAYGAANTGTFIGASFDDDAVNSVALPFSFQYHGTTYNNIDVCTNGFFSFVTGTLVGNEYDPISDVSTEEIVAPFGRDLWMVPVISGDMATGSNSITNCSSVVSFSVGDVLYDYGSDFTANPVVTAVSGNTIVLNLNALNTNSAYDIVNYSSYIKANVSGSSPNRVFEIEYSKLARYMVYDESASFKVRLYETSNKIEFLYGDVASGVDNTPCEVGLKGLNTSDFNSRKVNSPTTWATSVPSLLISDYCDFETGIVPATGLSYMWSPPTCTVPALSVTPANTVICEGESVLLTAGGAATYSWTNGPNTSQYLVTPLTTTTYTLIGANTTCTSSITYVQNVAPSPTLSITQSNSQLCSGQSATLTAFGATSYTWDGIAGQSQNVITPMVTTTYSLTADNGTCTASQTIVQNVTATPTLSIAQSSSLICAGTSATLNASGASSYSWNGVSSPAQFVVSPNANTTYNLIGSNGPCTATQSIAQNVAPLPILNITQSNSQICSGESATLTATGATTYSWNGSTGASQHIVSPTITTTYSLVASDGTCSATQTVEQKVVDCTGINKSSLNTEDAIAAYPNPFNTELNIKNTSEKEVAVSISDAVGKVIYKTKVKAESTETISSEFLNNGIYFISVSTSNGNITKKLIKQ